MSEQRVDMWPPETAYLQDVARLIAGGLPEALRPEEGVDVQAFVSGCLATYFIRLKQEGQYANATGGDRSKPRLGADAVRLEHALNLLDGMDEVGSIEQLKTRYPGSAKSVLKNPQSTPKGGTNLWLNLTSVVASANTEQGSVARRNRAETRREEDISAAGRLQQLLAGGKLTEQQHGLLAVLFRVTSVRGVQPARLRAIDGAARQQLETLFRKLPRVEEDFPLGLLKEIAGYRTPSSRSFDDLVHEQLVAVRQTQGIDAPVGPVVVRLQRELVEQVADLLGV